MRSGFSGGLQSCGLSMHEEDTKGQSSVTQKLAGAVSNNKKGFLKHINSKRRSKENTGLILVEDSHLPNRDEEKAETFDVYFASVFGDTDRPWSA